MEQSIKIGEAGSEVELPSPSRVNNQGNPDFLSTDSRSINGTLNTAYIAKKKNWGIGWDVISEANQKIVDDIIDLQFTKGHLNMIITTQTGSENYTVKVSPVSLGALIPRDIFYSSAYAISIVEV